MKMRIFLLENKKPPKGADRMRAQIYFFFFEKLGIFKIIKFSECIQDLLGNFLNKNIKKFDFLSIFR
ncbi:hypothetical protein BLM37_01680 [Candidatus Gracilibacteria bacterium GN02-873]|nr:hypothetical protein BLM37_01680 [Candidatus Gracilibacteria bacterium GN02-873]